MRAIRLGEGRPFLITPSASLLFNEFPKQPQRERPTVKTHSTLSPDRGHKPGPNVLSLLGFWLQRLSNDLYSSVYYSWHPIDTCLMYALHKKKKKNGTILINHEPFCSVSPSNQTLEVGL